MRFKLDENFGTRTQAVFRTRGYDVHTACDESLGGAADPAVYEACRREGRCLVTLDRDFADVTRFPPRGTCGIVVIRIPKDPALTLLEDLIGQFLRHLEGNPVDGQLWIVEVGRIRIHQRPPDEDD